MGTDELCMGWIKDETGRAVGLPRGHRRHSARRDRRDRFRPCRLRRRRRGFIGLDLKGARVVVQGFGAVGKHAARFLAEKGAILVAASDTGGTFADPAGLDVAALIALKDAGVRCATIRTGRKLPSDAIIDIACDIWIPAARPDVIHADNVVAPANTRWSRKAPTFRARRKPKQALHERGVLVLPDFIANAGGVICAAIEYRGGTREGGI